MARQLLIYSHFSWPSVGGVETYVRLLCEGLAADGDFRVSLVTQTPCEGGERETPYRVFRRPSLWQLWKLIRGSDVVLMAGPSLAPMILARLARKPFVIEHHGYQAACPNGLLLDKTRGSVCNQAFLHKQYRHCTRCLKQDQPLFRTGVQLGLTFLRRRICSHAAFHITVSKHVASRIRLQPTTAIYHGLPNSARPKVHSESGIPSRTRFAYVGRLVEEKGLPLLLTAASHLEKAGVEFELRFVGDGPLRSSLAAEAEKLRLREVRFAGFLTGEDLQRELDSVDVVVMPSIWEETAGLSAMEQMMRGRAVLAADIGGLGEVVGDGGVKFRPHDAADLAARMLQLTDPDFRRRIGGAARERAQRLFRLERMIADHKALILETAQGARRDPVTV